MIRVGLCCIFVNEPIKFRTTTYTYLRKLDRKDALNYLSIIILNNTLSLNKALEFCHKNEIGCFRITSKFFPLFTHPDMNYNIEDLKDSSQIFTNLNKAKDFAKMNDIRITFHPDQFVVLNSKDQKIVQSAVREIEYHNFLANLLGGDVINIHAGGVYGNKNMALENLEKNLSLLSKNALEKLTIENDDKNYTPNDLLSFCKINYIPFVYDIHHHRCLQDNLSVEKVTDKALETWNREPLFHISSPKDGWNVKKKYSHSDFINIDDFPKYWLNVNPLTVEVEAKAKELAVKKFIYELKTLNLYL